MQLNRMLLGSRSWCLRGDCCCCQWSSSLVVVVGGSRSEVIMEGFGCLWLVPPSSVH
jgi:hypothetical protein